MTGSLRRRAWMAGALLVCLGVPAAAPRAAAQAAAGTAAAPPAGGEGGVAPGEIQRMFDAYAIMRAQEQLGLQDEAYGAFVTRFKALQDARRHGQQEHARLLADLRRQLQGGSDAQLKDTVRALQALEARTAAEVQKAYEALDQLLDARQQAKFRLFEEQMERRKLDLLTRARQANRQRTARP